MAHTASASAPAQLLLSDLTVHLATVAIGALLGIAWLAYPSMILCAV